MKALTCNFELKSFGETGAFAGYASVFNTVDNQKDVMLAGAFAKSLNQKLTPSATRLLWQHQSDEPIGVLHTIREDAYGLYVAGDLLLDVARGKEAYTLLKSGAINGLSIGYKPIDYAYDHENGVPFLKEVELWEVSLVTFPANDKAGVTHIKSGAPNTIRELEHILRDAGFSRKEAKAIAAGGFAKHAEPRDAEALIESLERAINILQQ